MFYFVMGLVFSGEYNFGCFVFPYLSITLMKVIDRNILCISCLLELTNFYPFVGGVNSFYVSIFHTFCH